MRLIRALEVYLLTGRALSGHFAETVSPLPEADVLTIGLQVPRAELASRVSRRVDDQFARGVVQEVRTLLARSVPADAHAFSGLVYRQVMELLQGVRDEQATRELIVRENLRYAKRQLTWFRKEPGVHWFDATSPETPVRARALVDTFLRGSTAQAVSPEP
jgi:tRNA dimethylallyltransferase